MVIWFTNYPQEKFGLAVSCPNHYTVFWRLSWREDWGKCSQSKHTLFYKQEYHSRSTPDVNVYALYLFVGTTTGTKDGRCRKEKENGTEGRDNTKPTSVGSRFATANLWNSLSWDPCLTLSLTSCRHKVKIELLIKSSIVSSLFILFWCYILRIRDFNSWICFILF